MRALDRRDREGGASTEAVHQMPTRKITPEMRATIEEALRAGRVKAQIARDCGIHVATVYKIERELRDQEIKERTPAAPAPAPAREPAQAPAPEPAPMPEEPKKQPTALQLLNGSVRILYELSISAGLPDHLRPSVQQMSQVLARWRLDLYKDKIDWEQIAERLTSNA